MNKIVTMHEECGTRKTVPWKISPRKITPYPNPNPNPNPNPVGVCWKQPSGGNYTGEIFRSWKNA